MSCPRRLRSILILGLLAQPTAAVAAAGEDTLLPPLAGPRVLTSSFGEYRAGHYHGGLDFSTGGREGDAVSAPADGEIVRLRASGSGYGRAVYFRMDDGRTAVFAHLSVFAARAAAVVEAEQDRRGRYEVDFAPPPGSLRFAAGELIALTGSSGAGPAHLHAELREGGDASIALNPLRGAWAVRDTVPPTLTRALVEPAEEAARANGGREAVTLRLARGAVPSVRAGGPVRIWVETADRTDAEGNRLAPYRVSWSVDGRAVAEVVFDRVDWNAPGEVRWTFREDRARALNERWICLVPPPAARQTVARWLEAGPGWFAALAPGPHRVEVTAEDAAGHRTRREFDLVVAAADSVGEAPPSDPPLVLRLAPPAPDALSAPAEWDLGGARIRFPEGAACGALRVVAAFDDTLASPSADLPELEPVTPVLRLAPWAAPLRDEARVSLSPPAGDRRGLALYRRDDGWSFVDADTSSPGVAGSIGALEDLALFRDRTPPAITLEPVRPARRPRLVARITDRGAGVTWRTLEMTLDGTPLIAEWDPEAGRFIAHLRGDLPPGDHVWLVRAADRVGNAAERSVGFTLR